MAKANWKKIKIEYIRGLASYKDLAKKYKVSMKQISEHGKNEKWVEERKRYQNETYKEALARARVTDVDNLEKIGTLSEKMIAHLEDALNDPEQFKKYLVTNVKYNDKGMPIGSETTEREFTKFDAKSVRNLTAALKDLTAITKEIKEAGEDKNDDKQITIKFVSPEDDDEVNAWSS